MICRSKWFIPKYPLAPGHEIIAEVKDNGKGFSKKDLLKKSEKHFGLSIMKERVSLLDGEINITTNSNGTVIKVKVPKPWINFGG